MSSFAPSDVVAFINTVFPNPGSTFRLDLSHGDFVAGIVRLLDGLDPAVLPSGTDLVTLEFARAAMSTAVTTWTTRGGSTTLDKLKGHSLNPVLVVRDILSKCSDQVIPDETAGLDFITNEELRADLRSDIASLDPLMRSGQWKAAMVIGGSAAEAILLAMLSSADTEKRDEARKEESNPPSTDVTHWHLPMMARVAHRLGIITKDCCKQAEFAQGFRNLIHPGRQEREQRKATRAAALSCCATVELIIEELSAK